MGAEINERTCCREVLKQALLIGVRWTTSSLRRGQPADFHGSTWLGNLDSHPSAGALQAAVIGAPGKCLVSPWVLTVVQMHRRTELVTRRRGHPVH